MLTQREVDVDTVLPFPWCSFNTLNSREEMKCEQNYSVVCEGGVCLFRPFLFLVWDRITDYIGIEPFSGKTLLISPFCCLLGGNGVLFVSLQFERRSEARRDRL